MINYRWLHHWAVSEPPTFDLNQGGKTANVHFLAEDGTAIVLTMTKETLALVRDGISDALSASQPANPDK